MTLPYPNIPYPGLVGDVQQAAEITADLANLDSRIGDYSYGTWTPQLAGDGTAGTPTYVTQHGKYVKIGKLVTLQFAVEISAKTGMVGNLVVANLPFTSSATATNPGAGMTSFQHGLTYSASYTSIGFEVGPSVTFAQITQHGSNVDSLFLPMSGVASSASIYGTVTYMTDS